MLTLLHSVAAKGGPLGGGGIKKYVLHRLSLVVAVADPLALGPERSKFVLDLVVVMRDDGIWICKIDCFCENDRTHYLRTAYTPCGIPSNQTLNRRPAQTQFYVLTPISMTTRPTLMRSHIAQNATRRSSYPA